MTSDLLFDLPIQPVSEYKYIDKPAELEDQLIPIQSAKEIGLDIETTGLDPHRDRIRLIQVSSRDSVNLIIDAYTVSNWVKLLEPIFKLDIIKIIHNAKFELKFFKQLNIDINGVIFDTMLASQLLAAGHQQKHKLSDLLKRFLSVQIDKGEQQSNWDQSELRPSQLAYANNDVEYLIPLFDKLRLELKRHKLRKVAKLEFDTIHAVAQMELAGFGLDKQKLNQYLNKLEIRHQKLENELLNQLGPININSPRQLKEALFNIGVILDDTTKETLNHNAQLSIISDIIEYRKIDKLKSTYGELRSCFRPKAGYKLIVLDYAQIELRVLAEISRDFKMIEALNQGVDLHKLTASIVTQKEIGQISSDEREIAKTLNFGLVYGAGIENLTKHLRQKGLTVQTSEMEKFKKRFLKRFIGVDLYIKKATKGRKYEIRTLSGRKKEFPVDKFGNRKSASYTEKLNTPIQGTAADIAKLGLSKVYQILNGTRGKLVAFIHDEVVIEVPSEHAIDLLPKVELALKEAGQYYLPNVEISLSTHICDSWMEKSA